MTETEKAGEGRSGPDGTVTNETGQSESVAEAHDEEQFAPFEQRARSFGSIAEHYARFRPAPPAAAVDWVLQGLRLRGAEERLCDRALDLGAGTGALTRLLVPRARQVVAVEPDPAMRAVLNRVEGASAVGAVGEALPFRASVFDAALASSSWHWMDPEKTPFEVARVLRSGGVLGLLWNGADRSHEWVEELLGPGLPRRDRSDREDSSGASRHSHRAQFPQGAPFGDAESRVVEWSMGFTVDELVGLVGSYSRVITLPPPARERVLQRAGRMARDLLDASEGSVIELPMRCQCWRAVRD